MTTTAPVSDHHPSDHHPSDRHLAIDALDQAIVTLAARINASTYELLVLIREFDERAGWLKWGLESCSQWLHWRCDLSRSAAREKVRIAHALKSLPEIAMAFSEGRLSYSKVRALTRVVTPQNEDELLRFALSTTAARVEERCHQMRNTQPGALEIANQVYARREVRAFRNMERGVMTLTVELPMAEGALICQALDKAVEAQGEKGPEFEAESWGAQQADGLLSMARSYLSGGAEGASSTADAYQVVVHVDGAALQGEEGRSDLAVESVKRLCCDGSVVPMVDGARGEPLSVGRKQRTVPAAMKRALWSRDRGCSFPGCTHHRLVHEGGYEIRKDTSGGWYFRRPDGRAIPRCGYQTDDMVDDGIDDVADAILRGASAEAPEDLPGYFESLGVREAPAEYLLAS